MGYHHDEEARWLYPCLYLEHLWTAGFMIWSPICPDRVKAGHVVPESLEISVPDIFIRISGTFKRSFLEEIWHHNLPGGMGSTWLSSGKRRIFRYLTRYNAQRFSVFNRSEIHPICTTFPVGPCRTQPWRFFTSKTFDALKLALL